MEFRKLASDFSLKERQLLENKLKNNTYKTTKHTSIKQKEKIITEDEIYKTIQDDKIIEFHYKDSSRLLIRNDKSEGKYSICVVLDIDTGDIITAYDNLKSDKHFTLDTSKYISYIDISGLLKNTYKN